MLKPISNEYRDLLRIKGNWRSWIDFKQIGLIYSYSNGIPSDLTGAYDPDSNTELSLNDLALLDEDAKPTFLNSKVFKGNKRAFYAALSSKHRNCDVWFERLIEIPANFLGGRIALHFECVWDHAKFWVDGQLLGVHDGTSNQIEVELTALVSRVQTVRVVVCCQRIVAYDTDPPCIIVRDENNQPRFGGFTDLFPEVYLISTPLQYLEDIVISQNLQNNDPRALFHVEIMGHEIKSELLDYSYIELLPVDNMSNRVVTSVELILEDDDGHQLAASCAGTDEVDCSCHGNCIMTCGCSCTHRNLLMINRLQIPFIELKDDNPNTVTSGAGLADNKPLENITNTHDLLSIDSAFGLPSTWSDMISDVYAIASSIVTATPVKPQGLESISAALEDQDGTHHTVIRSLNTKLGSIPVTKDLSDESSSSNSKAATAGSDTTNASGTPVDTIASSNQLEQSPSAGYASSTALSGPSAPTEPNAATSLSGAASSTNTLAAASVSHPQGVASQNSSLQAQLAESATLATGNAMNLNAPQIDTSVTPDKAIAVKMARGAPVFLSDSSSNHVLNNEQTSALLINSAAVTKINLTNVAHSGTMALNHTLGHADNKAETKHSMASQDGESHFISKVFSLIPHAYQWKAFATESTDSALGEYEHIRTRQGPANAIVAPMINAKEQNEDITNSKHDASMAGKAEASTQAKASKTGAFKTVVAKDGVANNQSSYSNEQMSQVAHRDYLVKLSDTSSKVGQKSSSDEAGSSTLLNAVNKSLNFAREYWDSNKKVKTITVEGCFENAPSRKTKMRNQFANWLEQRGNKLFANQGSGMVLFSSFNDANPLCPLTTVGKKVNINAAGEDTDKFLLKTLLKKSNDVDYDCDAIMAAFNIRPNRSIASHIDLAKAEGHSDDVVVEGYLETETNSSYDKMNGGNEQLTHAIAKSDRANAKRNRAYTDSNRSNSDSNNTGLNQHLLSSQSSSLSAMEQEDLDKALFDRALLDKSRFAEVVKRRFVNSTEVYDRIKRDESAKSQTEHTLAGSSDSENSVKYTNAATNIVAATKKNKDTSSNITNVMMDKDSSSSLGSEVKDAYNKAIRGTKFITGFMRKDKIENEIGIKLRERANHSVKSSKEAAVSYHDSEMSYVIENDELDRPWYMNLSYTGKSRIKSNFLRSFAQDLSDRWNSFMQQTSNEDVRGKYIDLDDDNAYSDALQKLSDDTVQNTELSKTAVKLAQRATSDPRFAAAVEPMANLYEQRLASEVAQEATKENKGTVIKVKPVNNLRVLNSEGINTSAFITINEEHDLASSVLAYDKHKSPDYGWSLGEVKAYDDLSFQADPIIELSKAPETHQDPKLSNASKAICDVCENSIVGPGVAAAGGATSALLQDENRESTVKVQVGESSLTDSSYLGSKKEHTESSLPTNASVVGNAVTSAADTAVASAAGTSVANAEGNVVTNSASTVATASESEAQIALVEKELSYVVCKEDVTQFEHLSFNSMEEFNQHSGEFMPYTKVSKVDQVLPVKMSIGDVTKAHQDSCHNKNASVSVELGDVLNFGASHVISITSASSMSLTGAATFVTDFIEYANVAEDKKKAAHGLRSLSSHLKLWKDIRGHFTKGARLVRSKDQTLVVTNPKYIGNDSHDATLNLKDTQSHLTFSVNPAKDVAPYDVNSAPYMKLSKDGYHEPSEVSFELISGSVSTLVTKEQKLDLKLDKARSMEREIASLDATALTDATVATKAKRVTAVDEVEDVASAIAIANASANAAASAAAKANASAGVSDDAVVNADAKVDAVVYAKADAVVDADANVVLDANPSIKAEADSEAESQALMSALELATNDMGAEHRKMLADELRKVPQVIGTAFYTEVNSHEAHGLSWHNNFAPIRRMKLDAVDGKEIPDDVSLEANGQDFNQLVGNRASPYQYGLNASLFYTTLIGHSPYIEKEIEELSKVQSEVLANDFYSSEQPRDAFISINESKERQSFARSFNFNHTPVKESLDISLSKPKMASCSVISASDIENDGALTKAHLHRAAIDGVAKLVDAYVAVSQTAVAIAGADDYNEQWHRHWDAHLQNNEEQMAAALAVPQSINRGTTLDDASEHVALSVLKNAETKDARLISAASREKNPKERAKLISSVAERRQKALRRREMQMRRLQEMEYQAQEESAITPIMQFSDFMDELNKNQVHGVRAQLKVGEDCIFDPVSCPYNDETCPYGLDCARPASEVLDDSISAYFKRAHDVINRNRQAVMRNMGDERSRHLSEDASSKCSHHAIGGHNFDSPLTLADHCLIEGANSLKLQEHEQHDAEATVSYMENAKSPEPKFTIGLDQSNGGSVLVNSFNVPEISADDTAHISKTALAAAASFASMRGIELHSVEDTLSNVYEKMQDELLDYGNDYNAKYQEEYKERYKDLVNQGESNNTKEFEDGKRSNLSVIGRLLSHDSKPPRPMPRYEPPRLTQAMVEGSHYYGEVDMIVFDPPQSKSYIGNMCNLIIRLKSAEGILDEYILRVLYRGQRQH